MLATRSELLVFAFLAVASTVFGANEKLKEVFRWKQMDFQFADEAARNASIASGEFKHSNNLPLGIEVWEDKVFLTVPRWKSGVVSTLNYVKKDGGESPLLIPYPDWETNNVSAAPYDSRIVNTFRVRADECDRLWVMDSGLNDILENPALLSPPKILVFDLKTDKLLRVYPLQSGDIKEDSFFANIVVDVDKDKCDGAFAYMPDLGSYGLVVYDWAKNETYRVKHHFFYLDPLFGNYNIAGVNFQWSDGLFGIALGPRGDDGFRTMYFHPFSSTHEFSVSTKIIQNKTIASNSYYEYRVLGSRGPNSQASASFLDIPSGVLFYTQVNKNGVGCWNSVKHANKYSADTNDLVSSDNQTMIFPNDLKVDQQSNLWVITDRMPLFMFKQLDENDINFRVLSAPVNETIKGTVCDVVAASSGCIVEFTYAIFLFWGIVLSSYQ
uniref:Protein yellow n=1 Tax=Lygus hesperus TaxID=30085 RepID=A0A146LMT8_LYGHE